MASLSYYSASKLEPNIQEFNSEEVTMQQLPPELLFDFNYDIEQFYAENPDQACYLDPFFNLDEFILPGETTDNSCFMPEYSVLESTPKRQKVFQDNCLPDSIIASSHSAFDSTPKRQKVFQDNCLPDNTITSSQNSFFMPDYSVFESTPKRQKVFQHNGLPDYNTITSSQNSSFMPDYSVLESTPKRQKVFQDNGLPPHGLFNAGFVSNPPTFQDFPTYSLPEIPMPVFSTRCSSNNAAVIAKKGGSNNKKMSAQSIAARQRRKKITEKTQELGKLIPGGHRMNTAEMLQATFKYIKFLQAQAGLLEFMGSYKENEKSFQTTDLHKLVGSSLIQEKLYSSEKCLIPQVFLEALVNNQEFQNSKGLEEVKSLIR
ncbi:unnamed protein product [Withania somnifera]